MPPETLSRADSILGYLSFSISYLCVAVLTFGMPVGIVLFPRTIGLLAALPYWTYTWTVGRQELKDAAYRPAFSQDFVVFRYMRKFLRMTMADLPQELVEAEKTPNAQFVFAMFPHAVWADYHAPMAGMWHTVFPNIHRKIRFLIASVLFRVPIVREWSLWTGGIDASRSVAEAALDRGRSICVKPGGEAEQLRTTHGREIVYLRHRRGFLKLAMKKGVPVVPVYVFGANDYHRTFNFLFRPREWLQKRLGVCLPMAFGYWGSMCPLPVPTTIVFGKPISFDVETPGMPSETEVIEAHRIFCQVLIRLFDEHKNALGYGDRHLEIVL